MRSALIRIGLNRTVRSRSIVRGMCSRGPLCRESTYCPATMAEAGSVLAPTRIGAMVFGATANQVALW